MLNRRSLLSYLPTFGLLPFLPKITKKDNKQNLKEEFKDVSTTIQTMTYREDKFIKVLKAKKWNKLIKKDHHLFIELRQRYENKEKTIQIHISAVDRNGVQIFWHYYEIPQGYNYQYIYQRLIDELPLLV